MPGLTFHEAAVKFLHVGVVQAFTQPFKPLAAAGLNQSHR